MQNKDCPNGNEKNNALLCGTLIPLVFLAIKRTVTGSVGSRSPTGAFVVQPFRKKYNALVPFVQAPGKFIAEGLQEIVFVQAYQVQHELFAPDGELYVLVYDLAARIHG